MTTTRRHPGFTLIELLMVMLIIGVLIALLVPVMGAALQGVRKSRTQFIIKELAGGCEMFKADFQVYPPSAPIGTPSTTVRAPAPGQMPSGAANLVFYLRGPGGMGWGTGAGCGLPFGGAATRTFGPYYQTTDDAIATRMDTTRPGGPAAVPVGFLDAFNPPHAILYFRSETMTGPDKKDASGKTMVKIEKFFVTDNNPLDTNNKPTPNVANTDATKNYAVSDPSIGGTPGTQNMAFNDVNAASYYDGNGTGVPNVDDPVVPAERAVAQYRHSGYILVSPGPDGYYGNVKVNSADPNGPLIPVTSTISGSGHTPIALDDITNY